LVSEGRIIKGVGGLYAVQAADSAYPCRPRGILRLDGVRPAVGDNCLFTPGEDGEDGSIEKILPRRNALVRPAVANVDLVVAVCSVDMINLPLLDMYLVLLETQKPDEGAYNIAVLINKMDLTDDDTMTITRRAYEDAGYRVIYFSAATGRGADELTGLINGGAAVMAGQSGAGKSSIVNLLCNKNAMDVGALSGKQVRGKHTTRHAELFAFGGGYITDTPGFASLKDAGVSRGALKGCFTEFARYAGECRFTDCTHVNEPDCAVKAQAGLGIGLSRYENYVNFYKSAAVNK